ncbi:MAG: hypothetical protein AAF409_05980 [Pseudomonadota bacterium]
MDGMLPTLTLRPPEHVMRLARMGSFHATRLSFMRILLRRVAAEGWKVTRTLWEIDDRGVGRAVYEVQTPERTYSLVAFASDLPDHLRTDRVIAEAWDATFALYDGTPDAEALARLQENVPFQEAGRMTERELTLSRANRSVRLFAHVIDALASGQQPSVRELESVGYLMRTTAVYGSGKFGLADREAYCGRPALASPFQAEMLTVWLIRAFTVDIVEHLARARNPRAARLDPDLRRGLGVGNSTGLGMAPFLLSHPALIHHWMEAREVALARVRSVPVTPETFAHFRRALDHASRTALVWRSSHELQQAKLQDLRADLARLKVRTADGIADWDELWQWAEDALSLEGQEVLLALMLEPHGALVDDLAATMAADEEAAFAIDGRMNVGALSEMIAGPYGWAIDTDWSAPETTARLWYVSAEKLEPRLAERADEPLEDYEQPLGPGRDIARLHRALADWPAETTTAEFLTMQPQHRHAVRRVQIAARYPYAEVRDNTLDAEMLPIDLLRAKLSFFGATRFDPRSDRWVRISMFQGAPFPDEIHARPADTWMYGA